MRSSLLNMLFMSSNMIVNLPVSYSSVKLCCVYVVKVMLLGTYELEFLYFSFKLTYLSLRDITWTLTTLLNIVKAIPYLF